MILLSFTLPQGIVGLGAYAYLLRWSGQTSLADHYDQLNRGFVQYWMNKSAVCSSR